MTKADSIRIAASALQEFVQNLFCAAGVSQSEAVAVAESLVESNLRGHESHGVLRVAEYLDQLRSGELRVGREWTVLQDALALLVVDGQRGFGQVLARQLCLRLVEKCRTSGVACGTLKNCGHVGRLGEWAELAARNGAACLLSVNDNGVLRCVAAPGGLEPRISTNPLAIGVPTSCEPLVLDLSTSVVANGKIKALFLAAQRCPNGWLQDADGNPTTDPEVRFRNPPGTLLPMGGESHGYKGFGLGLLLDILVGGLSGGWCPLAEANEVGTNNVLMVTWNPDLFAGREHFQREASKLIDYVRTGPFKPSIDHISLPGDRSQATRRERLARGIPLDSGTWNSLLLAARSFPIPIPELFAGNALATE